MVEEVQPPPSNQVGARKPHYLPHPLPISLVVTLGLALLAHGLGIVRTPKAFSHTIAEKFRAGFTQLYIGLDEAGYLFKGRREGPLGILPMFLPTEDMDEADEDLDIAFLLLA